MELPDDSENRYPIQLDVHLPARTREQYNLVTATASLGLFRGKFYFSSTIVAIDSTEESLELVEYWLNGRAVNERVCTAQTRAVHETLWISPGRPNGVYLLNRVPISNMLDRQHSTRISVRFPPGVRSREPTASVDTPLVEIFGTLTPFDDGETLDSRPSTEQLTLLRGRLEGLFDRLTKLVQHVFC